MGRHIIVPEIISILTLAGGGVQTLKRLRQSMKNHIKNVDYRHFILSQGDPEVERYIIYEEKDKKVYAIISPENLILSEGYNTLLEVANNIKPPTDYFMFLDDDFDLRDNAPMKLLEYLKMHKLDAVAMEHSWYGKRLEKHLVQECGGGTVLFTRHAFNVAGYMDENYYSEWDADWTRRMTICHGLKLAVVPGSKKWARHYNQTGQRKHGMDRFKKLQKQSLKYIHGKWGVQGIAGNNLTGKIDPKIIKMIGSKDPMRRKYSAKGSNMIFKSPEGIFKL